MNAGQCRPETLARSHIFGRLESAIPGEPIELEFGACGLFPAAPPAASLVPTLGELDT